MARVIQSAAVARRPLGTPEEVAEYLGVPIATLYAWRYQGGKGPKSIKVGRHLRYRWADVEQWLDAQTVEPGGEAA